MYFTLILIQTVQSGHGFAHATKPEMPWHVNDFHLKYCSYKIFVMSSLIIVEMGITYCVQKISYSIRHMLNIKS